MDDGQLGTTGDLLALFKIFKKYPDIKIVMIAGNHDPLVARNVYWRIDRASFPGNLHLVEDHETLVYPQWDLTVYAASLQEKNGTYNPLSWIKNEEPADGDIRVGLCHGSIANEAFDGNDFPVDKNFARESGLDYLALGDWHSFKKIDDRTYYPGVPEPLQMGDNGYILEVTIEAPGAEPQVKKREVNRVRNPR
jgi:DNA repair exonuclease SbcCD nuclease subunit